MANIQGQAVEGGAAQIGVRVSVCVVETVHWWWAVLGGQHVVEC